MATKKSIGVFFGILAILTWVLGSAIQVGAETMNYKSYMFTIRAENVPVGDVEGHMVGLVIRGGF